MFPSGARKKSQPHPSSRGSSNASAAQTMSATISIPAATSSARAASRSSTANATVGPVARREGDARHTGRAVDLDQVSVPGFELEDRPSVVPVSGLQAKDVTHECRHRHELVCPHAQEGHAFDAHGRASRRWFDAFLGRPLPPRAVERIMPGIERDRSSGRGDDHGVQKRRRSWGMVTGRQCSRSGARGRKSRDTAPQTRSALDEAEGGDADGNEHDAGDLPPAQPLAEDHEGGDAMGANIELRTEATAIPSRAPRLNNEKPTTSAIPVATTNGSAAGSFAGDRARPSARPRRRPRPGPAGRPRATGRTRAAWPPPKSETPKHAAAITLRAAARMARSREMATPSSSPPAEAAGRRLQRRGRG